MKLAMKVALGGVAGLGLMAVGVVVHDIVQDKKAQKKVEEATNDISRAKAIVERDQRREKSVVCRIKEYVAKKVVKILGWVTVHMEQVEAAGAIIGLGGACISIAGSVKDFIQGNDTQEKLDLIDRKIEALNERERLRNNKLGAYVEDCTKVLNNNLKLVDDDIIKLGDGLNVKIDEHDEVQK